MRFKDISINISICLNAKEISCWLEDLLFHCHANVKTTLILLYYRSFFVVAFLPTVFGIAVNIETDRT